MSRRVMKSGTLIEEVSMGKGRSTFDQGDVEEGVVGIVSM